ncbi:MAG: hypothetical protein GOV15_01725, partial [Candidatus Diapherotrites archaeon]|nr:hypothetical protein [Candidatus Diapherotrites archaeon]
FESFETLRGVCWPEDVEPPESYSCENNSCTINTKGTERQGRFDFLSLNGKNVVLFECFSNGVESFKVTTTQHQVLSESNYFDLMSGISNPIDAYFALIVLKHPEQLKKAVLDPDQLEINNSGSSPGNAFFTDLQIVQQSESCRVSRPNFKFSSYPLFEEFENTYLVKRVWHNELNYFAEDAVFSPAGKLINYSETELMGCY